MRRRRSGGWHIIQSLRQSRTRTQSSSGVRVRSLSAGKGYTVALSDKGEVYVWGSMGAAAAIGLGERDGVKVKLLKFLSQSYEKMGDKEKARKIFAESRVIEKRLLDYEKRKQAANK